MELLFNALSFAVKTTLSSHIGKYKYLRKCIFHQNMKRLQATNLLYSATGLASDKLESSSFLYFSLGRTLLCPADDENNYYYLESLIRVIAVDAAVGSLD